MRRSVVVVATSDQPAIQRLKGAFVATAVAEHFRDQGMHVLLMMDSVTRIAWAQREIGLAIGEPPTTRGYTPSVFAALPRLLERSGAGERGSITGLYTVLVEGDDLNEPVADTVRGILDGHIVLSRELAERGHYPSIDILASVSRSMPDVTEVEHRGAADALRRLTATYRSAEDLINIGAYADGTNPEIDRAKRMIGPIREFLMQGAEECCEWEGAMKWLFDLAGRAGA
jgi:FliI/YscN family ATPase